MLAETPGLEGKGFETWRQLVAKFSPMGGSYEMDMLAATMAPPQAKDLMTLGGAIGRFERDWKLWEKQVERVSRAFQGDSATQHLPNATTNQRPEMAFYAGTHGL